MNIKLNNLENKIEVVKACIGLVCSKLNIEVKGAISGISPGSHSVPTVPLEKILTQRDYDVAKFDCEGCEYYLLSIPCNILTRIPYYIVEFHGTALPLIHKFEICGFKTRIIRVRKEKILYGGVLVAHLK